jgi:hypothetical protein
LIVFLVNYFIVLIARLLARSFTPHRVFHCRVSISGLDRLSATRLLRGRHRRNFLFTSDTARFVVQLAQHVANSSQKDQPADSQRRLPSL